MNWRDALTGPQKAAWVLWLELKNFESQGLSASVPDVILGICAEAWDKGHLDGCEDQPWCPDNGGHLARNPYRTKEEP